MSNAVLRRRQNVDTMHTREPQRQTQNTESRKAITMSEQSHKAEVMAEIKNMTSREEIQKRMDNEEYTTVRIWIWQYLQTL